jgi:hypothetical protein
MKTAQVWILPSVSVLGLGLSQTLGMAQLLPPSSDIPEEVLQTQIIDQANSPLNGDTLHPSDYAREQQRHRIAPENVPPKIDPKVQQLVDLLRIRKLLKGLIPFL